MRAPPQPILIFICPIALGRQHVRLEGLWRERVPGHFACARSRALSIGAFVSLVKVRPPITTKSGGSAKESYPLEKKQKEKKLLNKLYRRRFLWMAGSLFKCTCYWWRRQTATIEMSALLCAALTKTLGLKLSKYRAVGVRRFNPTKHRRS